MLITNTLHKQINTSFWDFKFSTIFAPLNNNTKIALRDFMKNAVVTLILWFYVSSAFAQTTSNISESIYRSFYNETITIKPDNPDKIIKRRYGVFIDTTRNSVFCKNLESRIELDDYYQSIIFRHCRDFKAAKKLKELWSFKDDLCTIHCQRNGLKLRN